MLSSLLLHIAAAAPNGDCAPGGRLELLAAAPHADAVPEARLAACWAGTPATQLYWEEEVEVRCLHESCTEEGTILSEVWTRNIRAHDPTASLAPISENSAFLYEICDGAYADALKSPFLGGPGLAALACTLGR
ncbi:MAG TPA: hypothetical protein PKW90_13030, partial [Myxococcota bacterium]|nr:hypothetical protein [Myxococcota bacterium]